MRRPVGTGREVAFFSRYALPFVSSGGVSRGAAGFSVVGAVARACSRASSRPRSSASSRCNALSSAGADFGCAGAAAGFDSGLLSGNGFGAAAAGTVGFEGTSRSSLSEPAGGGAPCARTCGDHASVANTVSERKRMDLNTSEFQGEKSTTGQRDGQSCDCPHAVEGSAAWQRGQCCRSAKTLCVIERCLLRARRLIEELQVRGRASRTERALTRLTAFTGAAVFDDTSASAAVRAACLAVTSTALRRRAALGVLAGLAVDGATTVTTTAGGDHGRLAGRRVPAIRRARSQRAEHGSGADQKRGRQARPIRESISRGVHQ